MSCCGLKTLSISWELVIYENQWDENGRAAGGRGRLGVRAGGIQMSNVISGLVVRELHAALFSLIQIVLRPY